MCELHKKTTRIQFMRYLFFFVCLLLFHGTSSARVDEADVSDIRAVIESQLVAFGMGDAEKAFSAASSEVQTAYKSANNFMNMIRDLYSPLLNATEWRFQVLVSRANNPIQIINFTEPTGSDWIAAYKMVKGYQGFWKIDNVIMGKIEGKLI